jgi:hypothetical protein
MPEFNVRSFLTRTGLKAKYAAFLAGSLSIVQPAQAVEYGIGDYLLGLTLPMSGYTPPPGVYFSDTFYLYKGSASGNVRFPIGKQLEAGLTYQFVFDIAQVAWFTDLQILGGSLGFAATVPFGSENTNASIGFTGPLGIDRQFGRTESVAALGDSAFSAILGWQAGESHWNVTLTGFTPTGYYSSTAIAFTGLNRPAVDIKGGYTFLSLQTGTELSAALGMTVNAINNQTNYQSGAELHFEWALNQHFPFGLAAGVGGYYYQQVTNDGGAGDRVGAFRGRVAAVGPLLAYTFKNGAQEVTVSGRWFHEFDVAHRVQGDSIFAALSFPL